MTAGREPLPGEDLLTLLEVHQESPAPTRVAAFLRVYASIIRKNERWDTPETMASAYESAARALDAYMELTAAAEGEAPSLEKSDSPIHNDEKSEDILARGHGVGTSPQGTAAVVVAARTILETFRKDEAQGYRSRDRQFAIELLSMAFPQGDH